MAIPFSMRWSLQFRVSFPLIFLSVLHNILNQHFVYGLVINNRVKTCILLAKHPKVNEDITRPTSPIIVTQVKSSQDINALADLRYDEWIANELSNNNKNQQSQSQTPSRHAFRMATAEIFQERTEGEAMAFLAYLEDVDELDFLENHRGQIAVDAAELSPMEFENVIFPTDTNQNQSDSVTNLNFDKQLLYVTDVVSSRKFRRRGIGELLMKVMENKAIELGTNYLFLHVEEDNTAALNFYQNPRLGYTLVQDQDLEIISDQIKQNHFKVSLKNDGDIYINVDRLAENAGTSGQLLLFKKLITSTNTASISATVEKAISSRKSSQRSGGGGFGMNNSENLVRKKRKPNKKNKVR